MQEPTSSYQVLIDGQLQTINVYPPTVSRRRCVNHFISQKDRDLRYQESHCTQKTRNAYDRAVAFGTQEKEAD